MHYETKKIDSLYHNIRFVAMVYSWTHNISKVSLQFTCVERDGIRRVTADYHKFTQVVTPIAAAVPSVVSLFAQISAFLCTWFTATDLSNAFFFYLSIRSPRSSFLSDDKARKTPSPSYHKVMSVVQHYAIIYLTKTSMIFPFHKL